MNQLQQNYNKGKRVTKTRTMKQEQDHKKVLRNQEQLRKRLDEATKVDKTTTM